MSTGLDAPTALDRGPAADAAPHRPSMWQTALRNPGVIVGGGLLVVMVLLAVLAPLLFTVNPLTLNPIQRMRPPGGELWFGTDMLGRDVYSRTIYGARVSLIVGASAAVLSIVVGLFIGLVAGYSRTLDAILMRVMDGLMAIPAILLAVALVSLSGSSMTTVIIAITIPEIPRVVRLVRSVVLTVREEPYVEAAVAVGTPLPFILSRHILPNTIAPLIVQATYVCASAIILEAILGFLGAGTPPEIPSWGNMIAEARTFFQIAPWILFFPGVFLAVTVLAINVLGDGLRDTLDPRIAKSM